MPNVSPSHFDNESCPYKKIKILEKHVRILTKRLERSEADRQQLEQANEQREQFLKGLVREIESSKISLEHKSNELSTALDELKSLQLQLIEVEKRSALGVLVAGVAHEINNPINFIHGNIGVAQSYIQDLMQLITLYQDQKVNISPEVNRLVKEIDLDFIQQDLPKLLDSMVSGTERISAIVQSLRVFSRLDEAEFKTIDIHESLDSTLMVLDHRLKKDNGQPFITIARNYGSLPPISCYAGAVNQVFMNIIRNAIDAIVQDSNSSQDDCSIQTNVSDLSEKVIIISTERIDKNTVSICIHNNGPAISKDVQSKMFDPFFTTKTVGQGSGLGLSTSHQIVVEQHGGTLVCQSSPNQGTAFIITLPIAGG